MGSARALAFIAATPRAYQRISSAQSPPSSQTLRRMRVWPAPNPAGHPHAEIDAGYPGSTDPAPDSPRVTRTYRSPLKK